MTDTQAIFDAIKLDFSEPYHYDHRRYLPNIPETEKWQADEVTRYAWFKHVVAAVLKPRRIIEIGVSWGVSGRAFLAACPEAEYIGYDSGLDSQKIHQWFPLTFHGFNARIVSIDSVCIETLPRCDLVHVDGAHDYIHAYQDVFHALRAAPWVLVDDCRDSQVAAAALQAMYIVQPGDVEWCYFPESYGGDILIHRPALEG